MAITSADIHNQSFSIDRKGYDVDEVDVFLEHVADEIDGLNEQIESLEGQLDEANRFGGFDRPGDSTEEVPSVQEEAPAEDAAVAEAPAAPAVDEEALREKDERIADLERQLEAKKADDNAIAQALIIAQRSADEILANAKAEAAATIKDAEDEADRILDKAEGDRQKVIDAIKKLEESREEAREDYKDLLSDFINDATRRLAEIGEKTVKPSALTKSAHARTAVHASDATVPVAAVGTAGAAAGAVAASAASDASADDAGSYGLPVAPAGVTGAIEAAPVAPKPAGVEKDLSGFGDADDDFGLDDLD